MIQENKKDDMEIVEKPEYADMTVDYVQCNGTVPRKPKEWYSKLLYNSKKHQSAKISTQIPNVSMNMSPTSGLMIELKFPLSKENAFEKRELLSCLKSKIVLENKQIRLE